MGGLFGMGGGPQQMLNNPEFMRQMMDSPIMQSMMNNPDFLRALITENPQIQSVIQVFKKIFYMAINRNVLKKYVPVEDFSFFDTFVSDCKKI